MDNRTKSQIEADHQRELHAKKVAASLPDSLFDDDEEMQRIREAMAPMLDRAQRIRQVRVKFTMMVSPNLGVIQRAEREMKAAALEDALEGNFDFPRACDVAQRIEGMRHQAAALELARQACDEPPVFVEQLKSLQRMLVARLEALRQQYVEDHPELLEDGQ